MTQRGTRLGRFAAGFGMACVTAAGAQPCQISDAGWDNQEQVIIQTMTRFDDGSGSKLYAGIGFSTHPERSQVRVEHEGAWSEVGQMRASVHALLAFDGGHGPSLFAGGIIEGMGKVARLLDGAWIGIDASPGGVVYTMAEFDDGTGPSLYVGGEFTQIGGVAAVNIARWNGTEWSPVGKGLTSAGGSSWVRSLVVFDDGAGPRLYAGGSFANAGGIGANHIAAWDGQGWSALGDGLPSDTRALVGFDDGSGPALFATQSSFFGDSDSPLTRWTGDSWQPVQHPSIFGTTNAAAVFDDGRGPAIYLIGAHTQPPGSPPSPPRNIGGPFRWDGKSWEALSFLGTRHEDRGHAAFADDDGSLYFSAKTVFSAFCPENVMQLSSLVRLNCGADACFADLNCDGATDVYDLVRYLGGLQWYPQFDLNRDGSLNFFDVREFLALMDSGCPNAR